MRRVRTGLLVSIRFRVSRDSFAPWPCSLAYSDSSRRISVWPFQNAFEVRLELDSRSLAREFAAEIIESTTARYAVACSISLLARSSMLYGGVIFVVRALPV